MQIIPVILSGGSGTRLWPLSRKDHPKQYLPLLGEDSLLQKTLLRLKGLNDLGKPIIVCNDDHRFLVAQQCQAIDWQVDILLEPIGRNTAPAITAAALFALKRQTDEDVMLLVLSADHAIENQKAFHQAIMDAVYVANNGQLLTFGIVPTHANTGYGYIKANIQQQQSSYAVEAFVEKPILAVAQQYLADGGYFWNSGMFVFKAKALVQQLSKHSPAIVDCVGKSVEQANKDHDFVRLEKTNFAASPNASIDYAVMEKSDKIRVVPLDAAWCDVGTWSSLYEVDSQDNNHNVLKGEIIAQDTTNSYVNSPEHLVVTLGVDNLVVVSTPDATLIADKNKASEVKQVVEMLAKKGSTKAHHHRKVYRPWGWYDSIDTGDFFQVKRLHVNPQAKLSLQSHQQRAEHWVVVKGIATVHNDGKIFNLTQGQSTYIPIGTVHSLANQQAETLEIIEVQSGMYLGEDDIERFEDDYGRV